MSFAVVARPFLLTLKLNEHFWIVSKVARSVGRIGGDVAFPTGAGDALGASTAAP
jgi:hypothetical protein